MPCLPVFDKQDSNQELLKFNGLLNDPATWSHKKIPTPNLDLTTETTSTKKFHRGTCRVSCHIKQSNQQLCPRGFIQNGGPSDQEPPSNGDENNLLLLGNLGYGQGTKILLLLRNCYTNDEKTFRSSKVFSLLM